MIIIGIIALFTRCDTYGAPKDSPDGGAHQMLPELSGDCQGTRHTDRRQYTAYKQTATPQLTMIHFNNNQPCIMYNSTHIDLPYIATH